MNNNLVTRFLTQVFLGVFLTSLPPAVSAAERYLDARKLIEDYLTLRRDGRFTIKFINKAPYLTFDVDAKHVPLAKRLIASIKGKYLPESYDELMLTAALEPLQRFDLAAAEQKSATEFAVPVVASPYQAVMDTSGLSDYWWDYIRTDAVFCPNKPARQKHLQRLQQGVKKLASDWDRLYGNVWRLPAGKGTRHFEVRREPDGSFVLTSAWGGEPDLAARVMDKSEVKPQEMDEFGCYNW